MQREMKLLHAAPSDKDAAEQLLKDLFIAIMTIGHSCGVTTNRMASLLVTSQIQTLRESGLTQQEVMSLGGYTLKTVRNILTSDQSAEDSTDIVGRIVGAWSSDPAFPDSLPLDNSCLLYTSPSPRDPSISRMPSSA